MLNILYDIIFPEPSTFFHYFVTVMVTMICNSMTIMAMLTPNLSFQKLKEKKKN